MRAGNLISPSHRSSLPPWPQFAVFSLIGVDGLLRRVAVWSSSFFCPACVRASGFLSSLSTAVVRRPPLASRVGAIAAAYSRLCSGKCCVSLLGAPATALRINAASLLQIVCGKLLVIMLMPSPAPNPADSSGSPIRPGTCTTGSLFSMTCKTRSLSPAREVSQKAA